LTLAEQGGTVIFYGGLPHSFSGYQNLASQQKEFDNLIGKLAASGETKLGKGIVFTGVDLQELLRKANIQRETMMDSGLRFARKITLEKQSQYFITNTTDRTYDGWVLVQREAVDAVLLDPMNGEIGKAEIRNSKDGKSEVYLQLQPKQSMFLNMYDRNVESADYKYAELTGDSILLDAPWKVSFTQGGPKLPPAVTIDTLVSWTEFSGDDYDVFSGTAKYTFEFSKPSSSMPLLLDLGKVCESAEVLLNGTLLTTLIGPSYQVDIDPSLLKDRNVLEVHVSNLMANRIIDLDKRKVFWKKFYNVNFPARKAENRVNGLFSAEHWLPRESGLLGPVFLRFVKPRRIP
jgi:hypothetical protein